MEFLRTCLRDASTSPNFVFDVDISEHGDLPTLRASYMPTVPSITTPRGTVERHATLTEGLTLPLVQDIITTLRVAALFGAPTLTFTMDTISHGSMFLASPQFAPTRRASHAAATVAVYPDGPPGMVVVSSDGRHMPDVNVVPTTHCLCPAVRTVVVVLHGNTADADAARALVLAMTPPVVCAKGAVDALRVAPHIASALSAVIRRSRDDAFRARCLAALGVCDVRGVEALLVEKIEKIVCPNSQ